MTGHATRRVDGSRPRRRSSRSARCDLHRCPNVLIRREAKRGRSFQPVEHTPTRANPHRARSTGEQVAHLARPPFHGSATLRHRLPSQLYRSQSTMAHRAATVLDDSGDRFEPFEAGIVSLHVSIREFDRCSLDSPTRPRGHRLSPR